MSNSRQAGFIYPLVALVILLIIGGGYLLLSSKPTAYPRLEPLPDDPAIVVNNQTANLTSTDDKWVKYKNTEAGFTLNLLKLSSASYGKTCIWDGKSYRPATGNVPMKVFEEPNAAYVTLEYYYDLRGQTRNDSISYFSECVKVINSIELTKDTNNHRQPVWEIRWKSIENDAELANFIKGYYGERCVVESKTLTQKDVYDIKLNRGVDCPQHGLYNLKYSPVNKKIVYWGLGQACSFWDGDINEDGKCADFKVADSLTFE